MTSAAWVHLAHGLPAYSPPRHHMLTPAPLPLATTVLAPAGHPSSPGLRQPGPPAGGGAADARHRHRTGGPHRGGRGPAGAGGPKGRLQPPDRRQAARGAAGQQDRDGTCGACCGRHGAAVCCAPAGGTGGGAAAPPAGAQPPRHRCAPLLPRSLPAVAVGHVVLLAGICWRLPPGGPSSPALPACAQQIPCCAASSRQC
jgi:hypothetical protein